MKKKEANKKPMRAKCAHCHEIVEVSRLREYKTCKCGAIGLDYGDGYYSRMSGNVEDFDKEFDKENGIKRFEKYELEKSEDFDIETSKTMEELVRIKTICGENIISLDELSELIYKWFDDKKLNDVPMQFVKMIEETGELAHEITRGAGVTLETIDALGDILVTVFGLCHHLHVPPVAALTYAWNQIKDRKGKVVNGSFVKEEE